MTYAGYFSFCTDFMRIFFTARTRFNTSHRHHTNRTSRCQADNRGTPLIWIRALQRQPEPERCQADNRGKPLIWIRALQRPLEPESIKPFFNYRTALLSRIAHSGQRSGWSGKKYVAVLTLQCSINGSPLRAVNCIQETTFRQTPPLSLAFNHEAGPGRMADSNAWMSWPACSKHPHWTRSTNELYVHTCRLVRTGISKFIYLLSSPSGVGSSKLREMSPQHILKHHACALKNAFYNQHRVF